MVAFIVTAVMILVMGGVLYLCKYKKGGVCKMDVEKLSSRMSGGNRAQNGNRTKQSGEETTASKNSVKKQRIKFFGVEAAKNHQTERFARDPIFSIKSLIQVMLRNKPN